MAAPETTPQGWRRLRSLLQDPEFRRASGRAVAEGPRLLAEALRGGCVRAVWATAEARAAVDPELRGLLARRGLVPEPIEASRLRALADAREPQGWLCEVERGARPVPAGTSVFLALDAVQDPGNLGALLRLAWACEAAVLLGPGCADAWSPKVLRAGAGAQFHVPFDAPADLGASLRELAARGVRLLATDPGAPMDYLDAPLEGPVCWVLGSEGRGLAPELGDLCEIRVRIGYPGGAQSLNVALSGAILLFETLRRRRASAGR